MERINAIIQRSKLHTKHPERTRYIPGLKELQKLLLSKMEQHFLYKSQSAYALELQRVFPRRNPRKILTLQSTF